MAVSQTVAQVNAAIRVNPSRADLKVSKMIPHSSLPLVALVYGKVNLVQIYKLEDQMHPNVHEPDFTLHGSFEVKIAGSNSIIDA